MGDGKKPKIRFPEFADDWEQRKFGDIGSVSMCKRIFKEETFPEGDIPFFKIGTFGGEPDAFISRELFEEYKSKFSYPEDGAILLSASGTIGRIVEYNGEDAYFQDSNIVWLSHDKTVINKFLKVVYPTVKWDGIEGSTIQRLYNDNFLKTRFSMPSIPEQEKIAEFFGNLDNIITLHQRKLESIKKLKKSMLQKMFPKEGEDIPEVRFQGFTDSWEQRKVQDIYKITRGYVLAAPETNENPSDDMPYPVYSSQTKDNGLMGFYRDYLYEDAITWTTDGANAGTVNYRAGKFYCTNVCGVLLSDEGYANKCAAEALNSVAWRWVSHVGNPKLMNNVMGEIPIILPKSIEEQNQISRFFEGIDNLITLHQRNCDRYKALKKSLIQQMLV